MQSGEYVITSDAIGPYLVLRIRYDGVNNAKYTTLLVRCGNFVRLPDENIGKDSEGLCIRLNNLQLAKCHKSCANLKKKSSSKICYLDSRFTQFSESRGCVYLIYNLGLPT
jgi:hypothetical protein